MNKQKLNKLLIWAVFILLATNISMAVSFLYHKKQDQAAAEKQDLAAIDIPAEQQTKFFREQLNLSDEQVGPFREFSRSYNRSTNQLARRLENLRIDMVSELGKANSDTLQLNGITTEIGNLHRELKNITVEYYRQLKHVCDEQQKTRLNEIFMSMVNKNDEVQPPQRGRRNRFGNQ